MLIVIAVTIYFASLLTLGIYTVYFEDQRLMNVEMKILSFFPWVNTVLALCIIVMTIAERLEDKKIEKEKFRSNKQKVFSRS